MTQAPIGNICAIVGLVSGFFFKDLFYLLCFFKAIWIHYMMSMQECVELIHFPSSEAWLGLTKKDVPCRLRCLKPGTRWKQIGTLVYSTWNMWRGTASEETLLLWYKERTSDRGFEGGRAEERAKPVFDCIWHERTKTTFAFSCRRSLTGLLSQAVVVILGRQLQIPIKASLQA